MMRNVWTGSLIALALLAACDRKDGRSADNGADGAQPRNVSELALPPEDLTNQEEVPDEATTNVPAADSGSIPAAYQGRWAQSAARCGDGEEMGLTITPGLLRFYESEGRVARVKNLGARAIEVKSRFTGEGESWEQSQRLTLSPDGAMLTITADKTAVRRIKCS